MQCLIHLRIVQYFTGISLALLDDPASRQETGHPKVPERERRIKRTGIFRQDRLHFILRSILQPLIQRAQFSLRERGLLNGSLIHADNLPFRFVFRALKMPRMPRAFHGLTDLMEIRHRVSDRDQQPVLTGEFRQVHCRIGKGIGTFLRILRIVAQHKCPGALWRAADIYTTAAHLRQRGKRIQTGDPFLAFRRESDIDHGIASRCQVDTQVAHLAQEGFIVLPVALVREQ